MLISQMTLAGEGMKKAAISTQKQGRVYGLTPKMKHINPTGTLKVGKGTIKAGEQTRMELRAKKQMRHTAMIIQNKGAVVEIQRAIEGRGRVEMKAMTSTDFL
jgi:hypothetical protein